MPTVSVIIPAYNSAHVLPDSIGSVLAQDYDSIEVVVADDGSTDGTEEVVRGYDSRVKYVRQVNSKASTARNLGLLHSSGDYVMFLDSDDTLLPTAIRKLAEAFDRNPNCGAAYCGWIETDGPGHAVFSSSLDRPSGDILVDMCTQCICTVHSAMVRRDCLAKTGLFDPVLTMYEDMDFWQRVAAEYEFVFVPDRLVEYRLWHRGLSRQRATIDLQRAQYMSKARAWRVSGRLTRQQWTEVRRVIYPSSRGDRLMFAAGDAFGAGIWAKSFVDALGAVILDPRYITERKWWTLTFRSFINSVTGARRQ